MSNTDDSYGGGLLDAAEVARQLRKLADCLEAKEKQGLGSMNNYYYSSLAANTMAPKTDPIQLNEGQLYQLPGGECVRFEGNDVEGSWLHPLDRGYVYSHKWLTAVVYEKPDSRALDGYSYIRVPKPDWRGAQHACPEAFDGKMIGTEENGGFAVVASQDWWQDLIDDDGPDFRGRAVENIRRWNIIKEYLV